MSSGRPGRMKPRAMVVLRMRLAALSSAAGADLARVARVARALDPGELLTVRLDVEPEVAEVRPPPRR